MTDAESFAFALNHFGHEVEVEPARPIDGHVRSGQHVDEVIVDVELDFGADVAKVAVAHVDHSLVDGEGVPVFNAAEVVNVVVDVPTDAWRGEAAFGLKSIADMLHGAEVQVTCVHNVVHSNVVDVVVDRIV